MYNNRNRPSRFSDLGVPNNSRGGGGNYYNQNQNDVFSLQDMGPMRGGVGGGRSSQSGMPFQKTPQQLAFDDEFAKWEQSFNQWKKSFASHPDTAQYREYERKFLEVREKLLQKRAQIYSTAPSSIQNMLSQADSILSKFDNFSTGGGSQMSNVPMLMPQMNAPPRSSGFDFQNRDRHDFGMDRRGGGGGGRDDRWGGRDRDCSPMFGYDRNARNMSGDRNNRNMSNDRNRNDRRDVGRMGAGREAGRRDDRMGMGGGRSENRGERGGRDNFAGRDNRGDRGTSGFSSRGGAGRENKFSGNDRRGDRNDRFDRNERFGSGREMERKKPSAKDIEKQLKRRNVYPYNKWTCINIADRPPLVGKRAKKKNAKILAVIELKRKIASGEIDPESLDQQPKIQEDPNLAGLTMEQRLDKQFEEARLAECPKMLAGNGKRRLKNIKAKPESEWTEVEKKFVAYAIYVAEKRAKYNEAQKAAAAAAGSAMDVDPEAAAAQKLADTLQALQEN